MEINEKKGVVQGRNIMYARIMRGKTQYDIADHLKIDQSTVSKLEEMKKVDIKYLEKLAEYLDVDIKFLKEFVPDDILSTYENNFSDSIKENDNIENFANLQEIGTLDHTDNSIPPSIVNDYMLELKDSYTQHSAKLEELLNQIADLRVLLAKNGIDYPQT